MPSQNKPTAIRFSPDQRTRVEAWARDNGCSHHAAVLKLVDLALNLTGDTPQPTTPKKASAKGKTKAPSTKSSPPPTAPAEQYKSAKSVETIPLSHAPLDTSTVPFNPPRAPMQKAAATKKRWAV